MQEIIVSPESVSEFEVDASAVADGHKAQERIAKLVERGKARVGMTIDKIYNEIPVDKVAAAKLFDFVPDLPLSFDLPKTGRQTMHRHALTQAAEIAQIPMSFVDRLVSIDDRELLAYNMNRLFGRLESRHLVRSVDDHARAIVSDRFRRLDSRPTVEALIGAFRETGLEPYEGRALETKVEIQAILPKLYSPFPGELCAFGVSYRNSDYGDGSFQIRSFILRPACANGLVVEDLIRQVHLGKRLSDDIQYADETYEADGRAMALAARDTVRAALSPAKVEQQLLRLKAAHETKVDPQRAGDQLRRRGLTKSESEAVMGHFNSPDVVTLPPGPSVLRMSNAISWLSNVNKDNRRRQEIQDIAGAWLMQATVA